MFFSGVHPAITLRYMGTKRKLVAVEVLQIEIHGDWSASELSLAQMINYEAIFTLI